MGDYRMQMMPSFTKRTRRAIAALALICFIFPFSGMDSLTAKKTVTRVVVLPFRNTGAASPEVDSLGEEFAVSVMQGLRQVRDLHVYDPGSVRAYYMDRLKFIQASGVGDEDAIREKLAKAEATDVDCILRGTYRVVNGKIGVSVSIISADGSQRYAPVQENDSYPDNIFDIQKNISLKAAVAIDPAYRAYGGQMDSYFSMTASREAQRYFMEGISAKSETTAGGYAEAILCFKKALDTDNSFLLAYYEIMDTRDRITKNAIDVLQLKMALGFDTKDLNDAIAAITDMNGRITSTSRSIIDDYKKLNPSKYQKAESRYRGSPYSYKYSDTKRSVEYFPNDLEVLLGAWKDSDRYAAGSVFRRKIISINRNYLPLRTVDFFNENDGVTVGELTKNVGIFNRKNPAAKYTEAYKTRFLQAMLKHMERMQAFGEDPAKQFHILDKYTDEIRHDSMAAVKKVLALWK